jgi:hypothetical protein
MARRFVVTAVDGRRIDPPHPETVRFPASAVPAVKTAVKAFLEENEVRVVVASAACGADLLALEAARELGLRTVIVLPFDRARFRETSVVDRGRSWGPRYDAALAAADARGDVIVLEPPEGDDDAAYGRAAARIVDETVKRAQESGGHGVALAVWDGRPRASGDTTKDFVESARAARLDVVSVSTNP